MKKIILFFLAIISIQVMHAQKGYSAFTYSMGFPTGDLQEYVDETSFRGINMEFYWHVKPNLDAGFEVGWNVFYKKEDNKTYTHESQSISGVQFRYTNAVPMIAGVRWRKPKPSGKTEPYFGAGIGTTSVNRSTDFGLYRIYNNTWQFCVRPEAGLIYKTSEATGLTVGVKYYANFENNDLAAQSYITANVGFVFAFAH
jgi:outer membrane protein W